MKKLILIFFMALLSKEAICQTAEVVDFNTKRNKISKTGFIVLGSWAAANMVYGGIASSGASGSNKYFNQMNIMWGGVNLGLAVMGYLGSKREGALSYEKSLRKQTNLEKTFLFNAGLDLTYIAAGLYLRERSGNVVKNADKFKGYGESVILQGGGLLIFDAIMYTLHNTHGKQLYKLAEKMQLTSTGSGIGIIVKL